MKKQTSEKTKENLKEAASTNSHRVHIVPSGNSWSVKKEGSSRSTFVEKTQEGALRKAKKIKSASAIIIHKKDGTFKKNK